jgi:hypothetical protein
VNAARCDGCGAPITFKAFEDAIGDGVSITRWVPHDDDLFQGRHHCGGPPRKVTRRIASKAEMERIKNKVNLYGAPSKESN